MDKYTEYNVEHIEPCIICGCNDMYAIYQNVADIFDNAYPQYAVFCNWCKTSFSNEHYEDSKEETIEWFNNLPRKEQ